jgi:hypothetical protein
LALRWAVPRLYVCVVVGFLNPRPIAGLAALSAFEIAAQPAFVNDWPCHMTYVLSYMRGEFDYAHMMTHHGAATSGGAAAGR